MSKKEHFYVPTEVYEGDDIGFNISQNFYDIQATLLNMHQAINERIDAIDVTLAKTELFPIGCIFLAVDSRDPRELLGYGLWARTSAGRLLMGQGDGKAAGTTGGSRTTSLVTNNLPAHTHNVDISDFSITKPVSNLEGFRYTNLAGKHSHTTTREISVGKGDELVKVECISDVELSAETSQNGEHLHTVDITHTHTVDMSHKHTVKESSAGNSTPFNVENPYLVVNVWHRVS